MGDFRDVMRHSFKVVLLVLRAWDVVLSRMGQNSYFCKDHQLYTKHSGYFHVSSDLFISLFGPFGGYIGVRHAAVVVAWGCFFQGAEVRNVIGVTARTCSKKVGLDCRSVSCAVKRCL